MKNILALTLFFAAACVIPIAALLAWPLPDIPQEGKTGAFLIRDVAIVDVTAGTIHRHQDVFARDGKIRSIAPAGSVQVSGTPTIIAGTGLFLVPGLWDMHTHTTKLAANYQHPLFLANGVTGVREMWGCMSEPDSFFACIDDRQRWNSALRDHSGLSPRYIGQGSFQINGGNEVPLGYPDYFRARNESEARQLVDYYADTGATFLKVYAELPPEPYFQLAAQARRRGLSLQGHRPMKLSLEEVIVARQRSIEHARLFLLECFSGAADFRAVDSPLAAYDAKLRSRLVDEHDEERCRTLMAEMSASSTWWTPTLTTMEMGARAGDPAYRDDPRLRYIPTLFRRLMWIPDADAKIVNGIENKGRNTYAELYTLALRTVGQAYAADVKLLTGSDTFDTYVFPGFSAHDELENLVTAGLPPSAALKTATIDAAIFSGLQDQFGSIEVRKAADMLLLAANPLRDIRNTREIVGLFFNGQFFDRSALDNLLQYAQARAGSIHQNVHLAWAALRSPLLRRQFAD